MLRRRCFLCGSLFGRSLARRLFCRRGIRRLFGWRRFFGRCGFLRCSFSCRSFLRFGWSFCRLFLLSGSFFRRRLWSGLLRSRLLCRCFPRSRRFLGRRSCFRLARLLGFGRSLLGLFCCRWFLGGWRLFSRSFLLRRSGFFRRGCRRLRGSLRGNTAVGGSRRTRRAFRGRSLAAIGLRQDQRSTRARRASGVQGLGKCRWRSHQQADSRPCQKAIGKSHLLLPWESLRATNHPHHVWFQ